MSCGCTITQNSKLITGDHMRYLIKNGSIIDPARRVATVGNVLIEDGKVTRVIDLADLTMEHEPLADDIEVINARGAVVAPGFIDLHTHLREPGEEHKETIATATQAAARGGFTTICAMPNTQPPHDRAAVVRQVRDIAWRRGAVRVEPIGAITLGRAGETLTEMAELTGAHIHICHVSTAGGVALIRTAKERGIHVTAEVTPHHLTLTDRWVLGSLGTNDRTAA